MKQNYKKSTNKAKQNKTPKIYTNKKDDAHVLRASFFLIHILVKVKRCMIKWEYEQSHQRGVIIEWLLSR